MNIPQKELDQLSPFVRRLFLHWDDFLHSQVRFNMPDSSIHSVNHCERVLLFALIIGEKKFSAMMMRLLKYLLTLLSSMIQGDRMTCSIPATAQGQLYTMSNSAKSIPK